MNVMLTIILLVLLNTAYVLPHAVESNKQVSSNISSYIYEDSCCLLCVSFWHNVMLTTFTLASYVNLAMHSV